MPIVHRFLNHHFVNGFKTNNTILNVIPYKPEVIFIGSFNHGWDWNQADFFYGRGMYFWPILSNLFTFNNNHLLHPRTANTLPNIEEIFSLCELAKITFADIVKGTKRQIPIEQVGNAILVNNEFTWSNYSDKQLEIMAQNDWLDDNVEEIVEYINSTPTIKHVYFTFKSGQWLMEKVDNIRQRITTPTRCCIFSPSGNGFGDLLLGYPSRVESIAHVWVWNGLPNINAVNRQCYCYLDHQWLIDKGVPINNF